MTISVNNRGFLQSGIRQSLEVRKEKLPDDIYLIPVRCFITYYV